MQCFSFYLGLSKLIFDVTSSSSSWNGLLVVLSSGPVWEFSEDAMKEVFVSGKIR